LIHFYKRCDQFRKRNKHENHINNSDKRKTLVNQFIRETIKDYLVFSLVSQYPI